MEGAVEGVVRILGVAVLVLIVVWALRRGFMRSYQAGKTAGSAPERAGAQGPTADVFVQQGKAAGERQDWAAAIGSFTHAVEIDPSCADAHCGLALAYAATFDMAKAKEHYAQLQRLDPNLAARFAATPGGMMVVRGGTVVGM
jgi:Flp pilus assembly protein TadD